MLKIKSDSGVQWHIHVCENINFVLLASIRIMLLTHGVV